MPNLSSPLGTANSAVPLINAGQLAQAAGLHIHFPTFAAFTAAVTSERANITASSAIWADGQPMTISSEGGARRNWSVSAQHARAVTLPGGTLLTLAADANTIVPTTGIPSSGVGANGDVAFDVAASATYGPKATGAWPAANTALSGVTYNSSNQVTAYSLGGVAYTVTYPDPTHVVVAGGGKTVTTTLDSSGRVTAKVTA